MPLTKQIRRERALDGMMERPSEREQAGSGDSDGGAEGVEETPAAEEEDEEEAKCKRAIEVEKRVYRDSFQVYRRMIEYVMCRVLSTTIRATVAEIPRSFPAERS